MSVKDLDKFIEKYSRKDLFDNKKIGLLIEYDEEETDPEKIVWKINDKKSPNVDLLKMDAREKKKFAKLFPGVAVNPLYAKPIFWFLPFFKSSVTQEKAEKESYYVEVSDWSHYTTFLFTRSLILMLTWLFGLNATLLALRGGDKEKEKGEYDFPTNKYCPPYTLFDCSGEELTNIKNKVMKTEHGGEHYHDKEGKMIGGGKDKLENLFKLLESNIDKTTMQKGGDGEMYDDVEEEEEEQQLLLQPPTSPIRRKKENPFISIPEIEKNTKPDLFMTLDYIKDKEKERYIYTQAKLNGLSVKEEIEQGDFAYFSKGPSYDSTWFWGLERGPRLNQFYSYVMRNSTRSINIIFRTIFKKTGGFIGNKTKDHDYLSTKIFVAVHIFALMSFFMNQSIILLAPFIIVLVWILKYAFMSKYSGTSAMTVVFDGFLNLGSIILRNFPLGWIVGMPLFLIPGLPFLLAFITIPLIILFKTWFHLLFGYCLTTENGRTWVKNMFVYNKLYIFFEIILINSIAVGRYYPYDPYSPFLNYFMTYVLAYIAPFGVAAGLIYRDYSNGKNGIYPILFCLVSVILTTLICEIG